MSQSAAILITEYLNFEFCHGISIDDIIGYNQKNGGENEFYHGTKKY